MRSAKLILERFDMSLGTGLGEAEGQGLPHRASGRLQRPDAGRDPVRGRDGAFPGRRSVLEGRGGGGPRLS
ncbi:MAG: hypothetical protein MZV70_51785, partial [Desulfobacterales bacterium]|nr:hypothetical protein [Desulfobacterales bacterium]